MKLTLPVGFLLLCLNMVVGMMSRAAPSLNLFAVGLPASLAVGVRPEMVEITGSGVAADVVAVEYLGSDTLLETRIDGHSFIVKRPGKVRATAGEQIYITLSQSALHWFDLASERKVVRN